MDIPEVCGLFGVVLCCLCLYARQHKFKLAIQLGAKVIDILETAYGSTHPEVALAYTTYVMLAGPLPLLCLQIFI